MSSFDKNINNNKLSQIHSDPQPIPQPLPIPSSSSLLSYQQNSFSNTSFPQSVPRSHINYVLDNYLVSSSPPISSNFPIHATPPHSSKSTKNWRSHRVSNALGIPFSPHSNLNTVNDELLLAQQVLDPNIGSPCFKLLSGFAVHDVYKFREKPIVSQLINSKKHHRLKKSKSCSSIPMFFPILNANTSTCSPITNASISKTTDNNTLLLLNDPAPNPARPLSHLHASDLLLPGGFRRFYFLYMDPLRHVRLIRRSSSYTSALPTLNGNTPAQQLVLLPSIPDHHPLQISTPLPSQPLPLTTHALLPTRTFFDFLALGYAQFGGAVLWDEDEYDHLGIPKPIHPPHAGSAAWLAGGPTTFRDRHHPVNWNSTSYDEDELTFESDQYTEQSALLLPKFRHLHGTRYNVIAGQLSADSDSSHTPLIQVSSINARDTASSKKAFLLLIKSFIGTGVLFLPSAFKNGGLSFSFVFLIIIAWLSARGMLLLAKINLRVPGSFGDVAETLYGPFLRYLVLFSISLSQIGFASAYMVFICDNLVGLMKQMGAPPVWALGSHGMAWLICIQIAFYVPMALVRKIKAFAGFSLIGDVFILGGLAVVCAYAFETIAIRGGIAPEIKQFNSDSFALYIGTSVYTFEGVGLVIPIAQSMHNPRNFGRVLTIAMILTTSLYLFVASVGYLAWGDRVETIVLLNLPRSSLSQSVFIFYILAIVFTWPLVIFPVSRIMEQGLLPLASGKLSVWHKWQKNLLRIGLVLVVSAIALLGAGSLDKLVALVGSFACLPLSFLYPCLLHLKAFPNAGLVSKCTDWFMLVFGIITMIYVTFVALVY